MGRETYIHSDRATPRELKRESDKMKVKRRNNKIMEEKLLMCIRLENKLVEIDICIIKKKSTG